MKIYVHKSKDNGLIQSMSRKGNCWDNAVAESFFQTLKTELVYHEIYEIKAQANQSILYPKGMLSFPSGIISN